MKSRQAAFCEGVTLNESPSEKEGKSRHLTESQILVTKTLNESPSEKEGK